MKLAQLAVACIGVAMLIAAIAADRAWFDRHFLPSFWTPHEVIVQNGMRVRAAVAIAGVLVLLVSRKVGRFLSREPLHAFTIPLAIAMSLGATELVLRSRISADFPHTEPRIHRDALVGYLFNPSRTGTVEHLGHRTSYIFDRNGYRVANAQMQTDFDAPAILFNGESMMVGHHLAWADTIPAQTSTILGVQSANIAVSGFGTDQSYLRLVTELPRFRHPIAVVTLFAPAIFDRNLDDERPHLAPGLRWQPARKHWRIALLAQHATGYRSNEAIERGIAMTRDVLAATVRLAQSRGAIPLIVVPQFVPEEAGERELRRRILDDAHLPYVFVPLDPDDRIENDGHPDADGAREIAEAIADALPMVTNRPPS